MFFFFRENIHNSLESLLASPLQNSIQPSFDFIIWFDNSMLKLKTSVCIINDFRSEA